MLQKFSKCNETLGNTSNTGSPMRVMMRMFTTTYGESEISTPYFAKGDPTGPIQKGTTYIVLPFMEPLNILVIFSLISSGSHQLLVGPASSFFLEQMNVQLSTRATSSGSDRAKKLLGRSLSFNRINVPLSTNF
jgi:hypothetical protein